MKENQVITKKPKQTVGIDIREDTKENLNKYQSLSTYHDMEKDLREMLKQKGIKTKKRSKDALIKLYMNEK